MKTIKTFLVLFFFTYSIAVSAQSDSLGLPGDQLDLYGVLDLFKNAETSEDFEIKLNSENNNVNNLDLNNDDVIDYIRVVEYQDGDYRSVVLQTPINDTESQDLAVIELEKTGNEQVSVKITGDEELYGPNYTIVPSDNQVQSGDKNVSTPEITTTVVNVWVWKPVRFYYAPVYKAWISPWRWAKYPGWWKPWKPVGWGLYTVRVKRFRPNYRYVALSLSPRGRVVYGPRRVRSAVFVSTKTVYHQRYYRGAKSYNKGYKQGYKQAKRDARQQRQNKGNGNNGNTNKGNNKGGKGRPRIK